MLLGVLFTKRDEVVTAVVTNDLISVTALLLLGTELEVLRPLQREVLLRLTFLALQAQHDLTGRLGLLVEHGLGLTSETHLLGVVTALPLGEVGCLTRLVLGNLVDLVRTALASGAVRLAFFGHVDHFDLDVMEGERGRRRAHKSQQKNKILPVTPESWIGEGTVDGRRLWHSEELGCDIISRDADIFDLRCRGHHDDGSQSLASARHSHPTHASLFPLGVSPVRISTIHDD